MHASQESCLAPSFFFVFRFLCMCTISSTLVRFVFLSLRTLYFFWELFCFLYVGVRSPPLLSCSVFLSLPASYFFFWLSGFSVYCVYVHVHVYVHDPPINHLVLT